MADRSFYVRGTESLYEVFVKNLNTDGPPNTKAEEEISELARSLQKAIDDRKGKPFLNA